MRNFRCHSNDLNEFSPSASAAATTTLGFANVERTGEKNLQNKNPAGSAIECVSVEAKPPLACMFERHFPKSPDTRRTRVGGKILLLLLFTTLELGYDIVALRCYCDHLLRTHCTTYTWRGRRGENRGSVGIPFSGRRGKRENCIASPVTPYISVCYTKNPFRAYI